MTQFKELEDLLKKIAAAGNELKTTLSEAHATKKDFTAELKKHKDLVVNTVVEEVARTVAQLAEETRAELHAGVERVIAGIEADWREKLGLDP